jgi:hypothetical protein
LPVLLPLVLLLFFHFAGGLHELAKILMLGLILMAWTAAAASVPQLEFPDSSMRMRLMESPTLPFTCDAGGRFESSVQKIFANVAVILLATHTLAAPKPEMV